MTKGGNEAAMANATSAFMEALALRAAAAGGEGAAMMLELMRLRQETEARAVEAQLGWCTAQGANDAILTFMNSPLE